MSEEGEFEVLPARQMREKYGLYSENRPKITLNPDKVPPDLRHLIPLAEHFGVPDDLIREDLISKTPSEELARLRGEVKKARKALNDWLGGPEADGPNYSPEYIAFSCMFMAADGI